MRLSFAQIVRHPAVMALSALVVMITVAAGLTRLVEHDLNHQSRLINVSCYGPIGNAPGCALLAFVISEKPQTVVVRGRGISSPRAGAPEEHHEVRLRVVSHATGEDLGRNENWQVPANRRLQEDLKHLAPADPRQSACVLTLPPGSYSALVEDRAGRPGTAGIELFVVQQ